VLGVGCWVLGYALCKTKTTYNYKPKINAMKKIYLIIVSAFLFQAPIYSQPCFTDGIIFTTQAQIDSFAINYPNCTQIGGALLIGDLGGSDITNLNGLSVLTSIDGNLRIGFYEGMVPGSNPLLTSLSGLGNLEYIGGMLEVVLNPLLTNFIGLGGLMSIGGGLEISGNDSLASLTGLDNLTYIGGKVVISGYCNGSGFSLTSLTGLDNVTSIDGKLRIQYTALQTLSGLNSLNSIGGGLEISGNPYLISLTGIDGINAGSITGLGINVNGLLSTCEVQSICDYLAAPGASVNIWNNAPGCNSQQEVEDACETVSVNEISLTDEFLIYPNPASNELFIESKNETMIEEINIYNAVGQIVLNEKQLSNRIDVSALGQGIFIIELTSDKLSMRQKLVIKK
jgi:hypothetical protein